MKNIIIGVVLVLVAILAGWLLIKQGSFIVTPGEVSTIQTPDNTAANGDDTAYCNNLPMIVPDYLSANVAANQTISDGFVLTGCTMAQDGAYVYGPFEGQVGTYEVRASDNTVLTSGYLPVSGAADWMTLATNGEPIHFEQTLNFDAGSYTTGTLIFFNENPSGEPEYAASSTVPVSF